MDRDPLHSHRIQKVLDLIAYGNSVVIGRFNQLSDDEKQPIMERALELRLGPTGYSDDEALLAAMHEMTPVTEAELAAFEPGNTSIRP